MDDVNSCRCTSVATCRSECLAVLMNGLGGTIARYELELACKLLVLQLSLLVEPECVEALVEVLDVTVESYALELAHRIFAMRLLLMRTPSPDLGT